MHLRLFAVSFVYRVMRKICCDSVIAFILKVCAMDVLIIHCHQCTMGFWRPRIDLLNIKHR